jgi:hypothetical protein
MKALAALLGLCLAGVSAALLAQDYPHAFPRTGVTRLFDNDRITVWEVNWKNGVPQPIHRHRYDMAGVYLRYGRITVTTPDGRATTGPPFEVPRPYFQVKDVTHREEAVGAPGDPERLAIMVDLKDLPSPPPIEPQPGLGPWFPHEGARMVLDNPRVRMWDYTWTSGQPVARHVHTSDAVVVFVSGGVLKTTGADGTIETQTVNYKDAPFVPRGRVDTEEAVGGSPRAIVIELK